MKVSDIDWPQTVFVSGTGTDVGKSYATGWLARELRAAGIDATTQKMVQTGNTSRSEDIETHRRIMGTGFFPEDLGGLTAPEIYTYPASPHLAAQIDARPIDLEKIDAARLQLERNHRTVLVEGAGGLMVPLTEDCLTADWLRDRGLPLALVVSGQLGSINHALMSLKVAEAYGLNLFAAVWNPWFDKDPVIAGETRRYLRRWTERNHPGVHWLEMPAEL